jgi:hypothetical protein
MARIARVIAPGLPHYITQRGNRRQQTLSKTRTKTKGIELSMVSLKLCPPLPFKVKRSPGKAPTTPSSRLGLASAVFCKRLLAPVGSWQR